MPWPFCTFGASGPSDRLSYGPSLFIRAFLYFGKNEDIEENDFEIHSCWSGFYPVCTDDTEYGERKRNDAYLNKRIYSISKMGVHSYPG